MIARVTYAGGLPGGAATVSLFDTTVLGSANALPHASVYRATYVVAMDRDGTFEAHWSDDRGATWHLIDSDAISVGTPGVSESVSGEFAVEGLRDFRLQFVNGATAQGTFDVNVSLSTER